MDPASLPDRIRGLLLGTAVGDALGLPAEGLGPLTIQRLGWSPWRHRLICGRGMVSDDTEHTALVARSLLDHPSDPAAFQRSLAWRLRWWMLALPAGVGMATARAIIKLWLGFSPERSGVNSAGNGPAMRCAILGVYFRDQPERMVEYVRRSTELTHTDPRALTGALAVSLAAAHASRGEVDRQRFMEQARGLAGADDSWGELMDRVEDGLDHGLTVPQLAAKMGLAGGVTGYVNHTVPVALFAWLRHPGDFETALTETLDCGGDTDTTGAIVGAMAGISVGARGIPERWVKGIVDCPLSVGYLESLSDALAARLEDNAMAEREDNAMAEREDNAMARHADISTITPYFRWWLIPLRNIIFLMIVLAHGFSRLLPVGLRRLLFG